MAGLTGSGGAGTAGSGGGGGEACTPASTEGIPFVGSCKYANACTDEYDSMLGAAFLQQLCEGQTGTWSTSHCNATEWQRKCTQDVFSGVYVQFLPANGACLLGCEEPL